MRSKLSNCILVERAIMTKRSLLIAAASLFIVFAPAAYGRSAYDGSWDLLFVTQRGPCDSSYSFTVDVTNGIVTHPNLVTFRGRVAKSGAVRASVTVQDKYATGAGRLFATSGRGPGAAAQERRDARVTGRRNAIERRNGGTRLGPTTARVLATPSHLTERGDYSVNRELETIMKCPFIEY